MSSYGSSHIWCLCEKLPRSILHIAPTPDHWCEVCGGRRRPRVCYSSSSDEEERAEERRQSLLAAQKQRQEEVFRLAEALRQEEQASCHEEEASCQEEETSCEEEELSRQGSVRVKVAMTATKPKSCRKSNCVKCGGQKKHFTNNHHNNKLYAGPLGYFRKPQGLQSKLRDEKCSVESEQQQDVKPLPTAPPQPAPTQPPIAKACEESFWERSQDEPNIVAFAHEVCNRPLHLRQCQSNYGSNLFVSDLIPLDKPITDPAGGAISKHRRPFGRPMRPHYSRPLPSLSQMLSDLLNKQEVRAKGGGVSQKQDNVDYGQFPPFDYYDGPSEDALVEDAARQVLSQPKALYIEERTDLPTTRLSSFDAEPSSDCSSSAPFEMPTAPPAERPRVGAPLRLHEMMKAVAQSGLSDSSASSSSTVSSSHKSVSSTLPVLQQPVRSCGGEEPFYEQMPIEPVLEPTSHVEPMSIMEKLRWIIEKNPPAELAPVEVDNPDKRNDSVEVLRQLMEGLQLENGDDGEKQHSTLLENSLENNFGNTAENTLTDAQHSNDMSNVLPLNSSNKSADAKYIDGVFQYSDDEGQGSKMADNGTDKSSTSMFSFISGLFPLRRSKGEASLATDELKPLKSSLQLKYGSVDPNQKRELTRSCRGKKFIDRRNASNSNCKKCGLSRKVDGKSSPFHSVSSTRPSSFHTAKTLQNISSDNSEKLWRPREKILIKSQDSRNDKCGKISSNSSKDPKKPQNLKYFKKFQPKLIEDIKEISNLKAANPIDKKINTVSEESSTSSKVPEEPSIISQNLKYLNDIEGKRIEVMKNTSSLKASNHIDKKVNTVVEESSTSSKAPKKPQNLKYFKKFQPKLIEDIKEISNLKAANPIDKKINTIVEESSTSSKVPKEPPIISQNLKHFNMFQGKLIKDIIETSSLKAACTTDKKDNTIIEECSTSSKVPEKPPIISQNLKYLYNIEEKLIEDVIETSSLKAANSTDKKVNTAFIQTSTSSTDCEIERKLADDSCTGLQLPELQRTLHTLKTIETVSFECSQIVQPKMVSSVRELGQLEEFTLKPKPLSLNQPFELFEFRTPDVEKIEANDTPVSEFDISELSEESLDSEAKKPALKRHQHAVWPAHSMKHRKRHVKYTAIQMELSYTENDKSQEENSTLRKNKKRGKNDRCLANDLVKKKIQAMMMKPIKLLSCNETTAVESQ